MDAAKPPMRIDQEVRFAVVMYGGVSLAIYIHGVAQELFRMVRATAPDTQDETVALLPDAALSEVEKVYRKLGRKLSCSPPANPATPNGTASQTDETMAPIHTRFVVDILSGTSAGGINAIFLAKALANNQPLEGLRNLWLEEGDIDKLVNDERSVSDLRGVQEAAATTSLLNGQRMYYKLLEALQQMEGGQPSTEQQSSPYVEELDLFVTATDLHGLNTKIWLADKAVDEKRHRQVFHFHYATSHAAGGTHHNDFLCANDPFLAFTARCTSSFPFAFEPMTLADIDAIVALPPYKVRYKPDDQTWQRQQQSWKRFYQDYATDAQFANRAFGDGGYLDNKPFSYATETLLRRRADLYVDRKLLYIEPAPELRDADSPQSQPRPNALENVLAATFVLPRYETIREDLQRLLDRNREITRLNEILHEREEDVCQRIAARPETHDAEAMAGGAGWAQKDLTEMILEQGVSYGAYHRLKVLNLLDELAALMCRLLGYEEQSDRFQAVRLLIGAWKNKKYVTYKETPLAHSADPAVVAPAATVPPTAAPDTTATVSVAGAASTATEEMMTENTLLFRFDLSWRLRRLNFVLRKLNELCRLDDRAQDLMKYTQVPKDGESATMAFVLKDASDGQKADIRTFLAAISRSLNAAYAHLRGAGRRLRSRDGKTSPLLQHITKAGRKIEIDNLVSQFLGLSQETAKEKATRKIENPAVYQGIEDLTQTLEDELRQALRVASRNCALALGLPGGPDPREPDDTMQPPLRRGDVDIIRQQGQTEPERALQQCLAHYYTNYEFYDMIAFPILYNSNIGEADVVDVMRISPQDAVSLIDEQSGAMKLAGTTLGNFGAFLRREWRENDMLWGRLDAAERLIMTLLPGSAAEQPDRADLITEAHQTILDEELQLKQRQSLYELLGNALHVETLKSPTRLRQELQTWLQTQANGSFSATRLAEIIGNCIEKEQVLEFFTQGFQVDRTLPPEPTVKTLARASRVMGRMLEHIADEQQRLQRPAAWITRLSQVFWEVVQVAVPNSWLNLLTRHLLSVLYGFELFLILAGALISSEAAKFGGISLFVTAGAHIVILRIGLFMRGRRSNWLGVVKTIFVLILLAALVLGTGELLKLTGLWSLLGDPA